MLSSDCSSDVCSSDLVEAPRLMLFVSEILYRFVVEQAVDRLGIGLGIPLVHLTTELQPPFRDEQGKGDVAEDRHQDDQREPDVEQTPQDAADEDDLQQRRQNIEQQDRKSTRLNSSH